MAGSTAGDEQHGHSSCCPEEVMVCDGWPEMEGRLVVTRAALTGRPLLCHPLSWTGTSSPWVVLGLAPLPAAHHSACRGSAGFIYITAAGFRCCHSYIDKQAQYLKSCYASTAYAPGKTIYIYIYIFKIL